MACLRPTGVQPTTGVQVVQPAGVYAASVRPATAARGTCRNFIPGEGRLKPLVAWAIAAGGAVGDGGPRISDCRRHASVEVHQGLGDWYSIFRLPTRVVRECYDEAAVVAVWTIDLCGAVVT